MTTCATDQSASAVRPWGLRRMTETLAEEPQPWRTMAFDADTQLTTFYDANGAIVDMQRGTVTISPGGTGSDGSGTNPKVADDSND
ncbi:putative ATP-grasp-modified RiPP [Nonomuraea sp. NBC_01738]|uniref:putative ATP-grasp-modified RiPP n=1 Tax=Nonomuraea sp. NBC_01738 TaxID=2976003 RepID=UPI002E103669|nr:putative ATP-grasp-modified RiPP [Nonomuraea sp. NBC_01738]